jgi:hypothetical protein
VKPLYTFQELAAALDRPVPVVRRMILGFGVAVARSGRSVWIPRVELEAKVPLVWQSLLGAESFES